MRRCTIPPTSCVRPGGPCCKGCPEKGCKARCLNDPERCRCCKDGTPPQKTASKNGHGCARVFDWEEMARLYAVGLTQREIAERMGCTRSAVNGALRKMGVSRHG